ncbi:TPA: hypothetical protein ACPZCB_003312 [Yersinia enterocolitica]|nr:hypothetical protein [Yersinia enterocolitica]HDL7852038.1 hypothetical protein [Yersinia enterocolitica]HDL7935864.1 hypothetical protein [Yersinia enterocolitica]HDL7986925.1 hypothetical protein [Yersinia enterocolitica]
MSKFIKIKDGGTFILVDFEKIICAYGRADGKSNIAILGSGFDGVDISINELAETLIQEECLINKKINIGTVTITPSEIGPKVGSFKVISLVGNTKKQLEGVEIFRRNYYVNGVHSGVIVFDSNCRITEAAALALISEGGE